MTGFGLQLSTVRCVRALELADEIQVQTCMKDIEVVEVSVAFVFFYVCFGIKAERFILGQDK